MTTTALDNTCSTVTRETLAAIPPRPQDLDGIPAVTAPGHHIPHPGT